MASKVQYLVTVPANKVPSFKIEVAGEVIPQGGYGNYSDFLVSFDLIVEADRTIANDEMKRQLRTLKASGLVYSYKPYFVR